MSYILFSGVPRGGCNSFRSHKSIGAYIYCTRGARSRQWWEWRGRRERGEGYFELQDHILDELKLPHGRLERCTERG